MNNWLNGFKEACEQKNIDATVLLGLVKASGPIDAMGERWLPNVYRNISNISKVKDPVVRAAKTPLVSNLLQMFKKNKTLGGLSLLALAAATAGGAKLLGGSSPPRRNAALTSSLHGGLLGSIAGGLGGAGYETLRTDKDEKDKNILRTSIIGALGGGAVGATTPALYNALS